MKKLWGLLCIVLGTILGMAGGQGKTGGKSPRRFGIALVSFGASVAWDKFQWRDLAWLLYIPLLINGYGVDSILGKICFHQEWLIRAVYALSLGIPFAFYGLWRWLAASVFLVIAFQVRAGSLGHISWFGDILIEDVVRYAVLMTATVLCIIFPPKSSAAS